jgi:hypothetical protein
MILLLFISHFGDELRRSLTLFTIDTKTDLFLLLGLLTPAAAVGCDLIILFRLGRRGLIRMLLVASRLLSSSLSFQLTALLYYSNLIF